MTSSTFRLLAILVLTCGLSVLGQAQSFDETWREFLEEKKVSNISVLTRPDKVNDQKDFAKYLLMNANSRFCQSEQKDAERLTTELLEMGPEVYEGIAGFTERLGYIQTGTQAYYTVDSLWKIFLKTDDAQVDFLENLTTVKRLCEKATMAKYTFMLAHGHYCMGDMEEARDIFENRTLRLAEKTSLKISDINGLPARVKDMKALFQGMAVLDIAWKTYTETGVSPGFDIDLPIIDCYTIPNIKALVLKGAADKCGEAPKMLSRIEDLRAKGNNALNTELEDKLFDLEKEVKENSGNIASLNQAWDAFIKDGKVNPDVSYGYDYCEKEPLIRAYILDGYSFVCDYAQYALKRIDSLQAKRPARLDDVTRTKIRELSTLQKQYLANGDRIEEVWNFFVVNDDQLLSDYKSTDQYCDNIHNIKDWTIRGLTGTCDESLTYLTQIDDFSNRFEFTFYEDLECRIQKLRIMVWQCRHDVLTELAELESTPETYETRLGELMIEYNMEARPEDCVD